MERAGRKGFCDTTARSETSEWGCLLGQHRDVDTIARGGGPRLEGGGREAKGRLEASRAGAR